MFSAQEQLAILNVTKKLHISQLLAIGTAATLLRMLTRQLL